MKAAWLAVVASACDGGSGPVCGAGTVEQGGVCVPAQTTCGSGTHAENGACVPDARFWIFAPPLRADGWTQAEVRVVGMNGDGSPSHEHVVLTNERPDAGQFVSPEFMLDDVGGASNFVPCTSATPGCEGPARFSVALASAPQSQVAHVDVTLVAPSPISSVTPCMGTQNILYVDGDNFFVEGAVSYTTTATFDVFGAVDRGVVHVVAGNEGWAFEVSSRQLGIPLFPSVFEHAKGIGVAAPGEPIMRLSASGVPVPTACETIADFQIHAFTYDTGLDDVTAITASFRASCRYDATRKLEGCVRYSQ